MYVPFQIFSSDLYFFICVSFVSSLMYYTIKHAYKLKALIQ